MGFDDYYHLGHIVKTHGLKGALLLNLDVDNPEFYNEMESVFIEIDRRLVPFFIQSISILPDKVFVEFEEIDSVDQAQNLVGLDLYLPIQQLPSLPEGQYYYHQLIGFNVINQGISIGVVKEIYELPTHYLLGVIYQDKEILVPTDDSILLSVDLNNKEVITRLPEGLLDIYLKDDHSKDDHET